MITILQTQKQMYCLMCEKFLCNLHYIDEKRIDYTCQLSDKNSIYKSYRNFLCSLNKMNFNSVSVINKLDEFNFLAERKKINQRKIEISSQDYTEAKKIKNNCKSELCSNCCYKNNPKNIRKYEYSFIDNFIKSNKVVSEYINKLFTIYLYDPCSIFKNLCNLLQGEIHPSCEDIVMYLLDNYSYNEIEELSKDVKFISNNRNNSCIKRTNSRILTEEGHENSKSK